MRSALPGGLSQHIGPEPATVGAIKQRTQWHVHLESLAEAGHHLYG